MKIDRLIGALAFVAAIAVSPIFAQQKVTPTQPAAAPVSTGTVPESKIALIYSEAFLDPKTGIARFNTLLTNLNREFEPRQKELQMLQTQMDQLTEDIRKTQIVQEPKITQQKQDKLDQLKKDLQRKGEDAQTAYNKRRTELFSPLQDDIGKALEAFAKQRGINVIIDASQVPVVYAADSIDVTRAFINEFNSKNPATASVTPPE